MKTLAFALALLGAVAFSTSAFAEGDKTCPAGQVWDTTQQTCVAQAAS